MSDDVIVAFDDFIHGSTTVYSSSLLAARLGEMEAFAIQAIAEGADGTPTSTLTIQVEATGDGRNWAAKNPTAEVSTSVSPNALTVATGYDMGVRPAGALVRLRIDVAAALGTPGARLKVLVRETPGPKLSPASIPGCNLWLRADRLVTLDQATGTLVTDWGDGSPAGHGASQATGSRQPRYDVQPINGLPTAYFDASTAGSEKILSLAGSLSLAAGHVFLVGQSVNAIPPTAARSGLWRLGGSGTPTAFPYIDGLLYDDFGSSSSYTEGAPVVSLTSPYCYEVRATSSGWTSFLNGTQQFTNGTNTVAWSGTLEMGGNSASGRYFDGHLAEVALYDHVLSDAERTALVFYLNQRYALGMT